MKKGFTLIELLAVIVILAIIALIATPIILGIINDAREESNERSVELYASAVRNGIAAYQLTGTKAPTKFSDLDIQYDGNVVCSTEELYEDGSFYIADCTVNGAAVEYTYGEQQVTQLTRYYSWSSGSVGEDLPDDAKRTVAELNPSYPYYLGLDVDADGKVSTGYVCFTRNETEYCLKGTTDGSAYDANKTVLEEAFGTNACYFGDVNSMCDADGLDARAHSDGTVYATGGYEDCGVYTDGSFACNE